MQGMALAGGLAGLEGYGQACLVEHFDDPLLQMVTVKGPFLWHGHADTDALCLVLHGQIALSKPGGYVELLGAGETFVVPHRTEPCPVAQEEAQLLLIERRQPPAPALPRTATSGRAAR